MGFNKLLSSHLKVNLNNKSYFFSFSDAKYFLIDKIIQNERAYCKIKSIFVLNILEKIYHNGKTTIL